MNLRNNIDSTKVFSFFIYVHDVLTEQINREHIEKAAIIHAKVQ
ncbi:hypothetical protein [Pectinatus frisingensis]|nr:hypothetical protein [Pectinatus frisingensis]